MKKLVSLILLVSVTLVALMAQSPEEAERLHQLGRSMLQQGKIIEGRNYTKQAMDMRKKLFGEKHPDYITSLNNYAGSFMMGDNPDLDRAIALEQQVMKLCAKLKPPHPKFNTFAFLMGNMYFQKEDYPNAAKYWEQSLAFTEKFSEMYEHLLEFLGYVYIELNDVKNMERIMALTEEVNQRELQKPCEEADCMLSRAQYYSSTGDNAQAKIWFQKALDYAEGNADGELKVTVLETYGRHIGMYFGDYVSGAEYFHAAARLQKVLFGEDDKYASLMYTSGDYSFIGALYSQAVDCYSQALSCYQRSLSAQAAENAAKCYKGMGNAYSAIRNYGHAKESFQQEVAYYERYDQANEEYPKAILRLAKAEKHNEDYEESITHHQLAMQLFDERGMRDKYVEARTSLKLCYLYKGDNNNAYKIDSTYVDFDRSSDLAEQKAERAKYINEEIDRLPSTRKYSSKLSYAHSLSIIAGGYARNEEYAKSTDYYKQYMTAIREAVCEEFRKQNENDRMIIWSREVSTLQDLKELFFDLPESEKALTDDLTALIYDAALLSKGILLNSAIEYEKVLQEKGDEELFRIYAQLKENQKEIELLRSNPADQIDHDKILQLTKANQTIQEQLNQSCAEMADFTNYISYTWKDVRQSMRKKDVAIEFVEFDVNVFDKNNYIYAVVLTQDMAVPVAVPVADLQTVKQMVEMDTLFVMKGNPVWGVLSQYLSGKDRILFSADGGFNNIGIEYLNYNGKPLSEQFKVYRLSSTKELCRRHQAVQLDYVALFGDINYNEPAAATSAPQQELVSMRSGGNEFGTLSYTKKEVAGIQNVLKTLGVKNVTVLTDNEASREAFLTLDGSKVNVIHIATHGAYLEAKNSTDKESMSNSLLAFAGANLAEEGSNEGLVTAADIADMNLRQCDLVVLSACETGLGKLGGDGVFGLQRGFKNAGVHTLLMSLKKVYDASTSEMMISFYRHLERNGGNKREALVEAQKELRAKGYTDAKYWAVFILLDAD